MSVTLERLFEAHGLNCAVLWVHGTHRCGYVRVPESHPWHGCDYGKPAPGAPPSDEVLGNYEVAEDLNIIAAFCYGISSDEARTEMRTHPEYRVAVHGGLTFSGELSHADLDGWWFGFDCHHLDDTPGEWTEERVAEECARLAEQIASIKVGVS